MTSTVGISEDMYHFLAVSVGNRRRGVTIVGLTGLVNTGSGVVGDYNYREGVSVWFRSIFYAPPVTLREMV